MSPTTASSSSEAGSRSRRAVRHANDAQGATDRWSAASKEADRPLRVECAASLPTRAAVDRRVALLAADRLVPKWTGQPPINPFGGRFSTTLPFGDNRRLFRSVSCGRSRRQVRMADALDASTIATVYAPVVRDTRISFDHRPHTAEDAGIAVALPTSRSVVAPRKLKQSVTASEPCWTATEHPGHWRTQRGKFRRARGDYQHEEHNGTMRSCACPGTHRRLNSSTLSTRRMPSLTAA